MTTIRAIVENGQIHLAVPPDIPDGTPVEVHIAPVVEQIGIAEENWHSDPESIEQWIQDVQHNPPIEFLNPDAFDKEFQDANREAVRRQMLGDQK